MDALIPVMIMVALLPLALFLGSSSSGRTMTARKIIAGSGAIFFAIYGVVVPEAGSESLVMTALGIVIFYSLNTVGNADKPRE